MPRGVLGDGCSRRGDGEAQPASSRSDVGWQLVTTEPHADAPHEALDRLRAMPREPNDPARRDHPGRDAITVGFGERG